MGDTKKIFDALLILQYQSGNKKALSILVNRHHPRLCKHAYWYTHDMDAARDIVQDSWSVILKKIGTLRDPNVFGSWSMRIVTRKSLDYLNKNKRERDKLKSITRDTNEDNLDNRASDLERLKVVMKTLPQDHRQVLRLFYTEEYSLKEISDILGIATGTVKSRLFHAREKLKTILKNRNYE
ncbi:RNA polymerase sigma factor [Muriicola sp. Z0-33]|uniref:RNA polymerase sigma factor n=1 Tax=Muriicola sp. Z0-33 TaxID=2816957 RepID=UPI002238F0F6|nr:RNA polymerase sigma factor [Muriicola sp. Z0-33]MCW5516504.1 RNA polymerase sigma factor [Muriicola sp. Z0-33]